jgi:hypothetical protein
MLDAGVAFSINEKAQVEPTMPSFSMMGAVSTPKLAQSGAPRRQLMVELRNESILHLGFNEVAPQCL